MKVTSKLDIPDSFDSAMITKLSTYHSTRPNTPNYTNDAQNVITYARVQMHKAYKLGLQQGKLEGITFIKELQEALESNE